MKQETQKGKKKPSSVRHTRAVQRDRSKRPVVAPPEKEVASRLHDLIMPAILKVQEKNFHWPGLRIRKLGLVVMMAFVLSLIWRQIGNIQEGVRLLNSEGLLWAEALRVSQQAISLRMGSLPAYLFLDVLLYLLPLFHSRWNDRSRPLPPEIQWAKERYTQVVACDGSTLDALLRKIGLLRGASIHPLAGRMTALLDLCSRLPSYVWYESDPKAHDQRFWPKIIDALKPGALLIFDLGYTNFKVFVELTASGIYWITRAKSNLSYQTVHELVRTSNVHDQLIWVGSGADRQLIRLIEILYRGKWYRYLTNELDWDRLPTEYVVALYWQRWRIEEAYSVVKRLLGLAYFFTGSENGVCMQLWTTWILYMVLVDMTDSVAEAMNKPFARISIEMVYRSLYFYQQAVKGDDATDLITYLVFNAKWLGIVKRKQKTLSLGLLKNLLTNSPGP